MTDGCLWKHVCVWKQQKSHSGRECIRWIDPGLTAVSSIDAAWDLWEQKFMPVMEECIPRATISQQWKLPWMNRWIKSKIRKRNSIYRKARTTGCSSLWSKYVSLRNEVVHLLRQSKKNHLKRMSKLGSKQFWKTIKYMKKTSTQVPTLKNGTREASSNMDKASLLNKVFSQNFNNTIPPLSELDCQCFIADSSSPLSVDILCTELRYST